MMDEPSGAALRSAEMPEGMGRGFVWVFVLSERCDFYGPSNLAVHQGGAYFRSTSRVAASTCASGSVGDEHLSEHPSLIPMKHMLW